MLALTLVAGIAGIAVQWRRAEAARKSALASDVEAQELLSELLQSDAVPAMGYRPLAPRIDSLLKAEVHWKHLLQKNPGEIALRIGLTKIYGCLGSLYGARGQLAESDASLQQAQELWEHVPSQLAGDPACRDWLATTYSWQRGGGISTYLQRLLRAHAVWEKLAEEQPDNLEFMHKIWSSRHGMTDAIAREWYRSESAHVLEDERAELQRTIRQNPGDRVLRKRLALTCFLLGEIYAQHRTREEASSLWRESYEQYDILADKTPDDLLTNISLAISGSRLIQGQASDPYYLRAVPLLERVGQRLGALSKQAPEEAWLQGLLLEDYCYLALCHVNARQTAKATQISNDFVATLTPPLDTERVDPGFALEHARVLLSVGQLLREAQQSAAARRLAQQAADLCAKLAVYPPRDPAFLFTLAYTSMHCSALLNQLEQPALALEQAELARATIEKWIRSSPEVVGREDSLRDAWERIAKARWGLGQRDQALAAFRESMAIQKRCFAREPSDIAGRAILSRCCDKVAYYSSLAGDFRTSYEALLERTRLWPDNAERLAKSAGDFELLARRLTARARGHLSPDDEAERDRYLAEGRRARQAAEAATRRAGHDNLRAER